MVVSDSPFCRMCIRGFESVSCVSSSSVRVGCAAGCRGLSAGVLSLFEDITATATITARTAMGRTVQRDMRVLGCVGVVCRVVSGILSSSARGAVVGAGTAAAVVVLGSAVADWMGSSGGWSVRMSVRTASGVKVSLL